MPEDDRIELARAAREAEERRAARRSHAGAEPSDPPPSSKGPLKTHAEFWGAVAKIGGGITIVVGVFAGAVKFIVREEIAAFRASLDPMALRQERVDKDDPRPKTLSDRFDEITAGQAKLERAMTSPNNPESELGRRLDRFDQILSKQFGESTKTTPPPTVGPTAKKQGRQ